MKALCSIIALVPYLLFSQANLILGSDQDEEFGGYTCGSKGKIEFWLSDFDTEIDIETCKSSTNQRCLLIEITGIAPWEKDMEKEACIIRLDEYFTELQAIKRCIDDYDRITFKLAEGLFVTKKEGSKKFKKKTHSELSNGLIDLNLNKFVERYQNQLDQYFNGKTVYIVNWGW